MYLVKTKTFLAIGIAIISAIIVSYGLYFIYKPPTKQQAIWVTDACKKELNYNEKIIREKYPYQKIEQNPEYQALLKCEAQSAKQRRWDSFKRYSLYIIGAVILSLLIYLFDKKTEFIKIKQQTYKILGYVSILFSIMLIVYFKGAIIEAFRFLNWDYLLIASAIITPCIAGFLYLFFGTGKIQINRMSNLSIKLIVCSIVINIIVSLGFLMGFGTVMGSAILLAIIFAFSGLLATISLILLIISIFKNSK